MIINSYVYGQPLFLDLYQNASIACSIRKLGVNYSGASIRVRRSNDGVEQDIGFDPNGDLNTTSLLSFVGAGNSATVSKFYDQSGGQNDLVQTDPTKQPLIVNSGSLILENELPALRFDGTDDNFQIASLTLPTHISMFIITNMANVFGKSITVIHGDVTDGFSFNLVNSPFLRFYRSGVQHNSGSSSFTSNGIDSIISAFYGPAVPNNFKVFRTLDEITLSSPSGSLLPNTNVTKPFSIGSPLQGTLQEFILYPNDKFSSLSNIRNVYNTVYKIWSSAPIWNGSTQRVLDLHPGAKVAYSTRALSSTYVGPILRILRQSDFSEFDIYALENGELDVNFLLSRIGSSTGSIARWYDQTPTKFNLISTSAAVQATMVSAGTLLTENGKPTMRFDGVNDRLWYWKFNDIPNRLIFRNINSATVFMVARFVSFSPGNRTLFICTTQASPGNTPRFNLHGSNLSRTAIGSRRLEAQATSTINATTPINTTELYLTTAIADWINSDAYIYRNGVLDGTLTTFTTDGPSEDVDNFSFSVGSLANSFGVGQQSNSDICEVIVYETIPDRENIEINIKNHYVIS